MRSHTDDKPWGCSVCGKFFKAKAGREKHMLIHTGEKPFKCDLCEKSFRAKYDLKLHTKYHIKRAGQEPEPEYLRPRYVEEIMNPLERPEGTCSSPGNSTADEDLLPMFLIETETGTQMALIQVPDASQRALLEAAGKSQVKNDPQKS
jgi:hypothetical protein